MTPTPRQPTISLPTAISGRQLKRTGGAITPTPRLVYSHMLPARRAPMGYLRQEPAKTSRSRIKRLRGITRPPYWLRVEDVRVFYDVTGKTVEVLAIVAKDEADRWLKKAGESHEDRSPE